MTVKGKEDSRARLVVDRVMLHGTLRDAWKTSWWRSIFYVKAAWGYYRMVRTLGAASFRFRRTQEEVDAVTVEQLLQEKAAENR